MTGAGLITAERQRQIDVEGFTAEHDAKHTKLELFWASMCYMWCALDQIKKRGPFAILKENLGIWPDTLSIAWWKPSADPIRNLVKAGALIAAEIDRLQREKDKEQ